MAATAPSATSNVSAMVDPEDLAEIRKRVTLGLNERKKYEPLWHECLAFASGRQWVRWQGRGAYRQLVTEPVKQGVDRYTADLIAQYRQTVHGELSLDDDRPQLLFRQDDLPTEDYAEQANDAVSYGWDYEWASDRALEIMRRHLIDVGTAAVRCTFDPTVGPLKTSVPHLQGKPIWDVQQAIQIHDQGGQLTFKDLHEGRVRWEAGSAFNLIVPPGIPREEDFPWEVWDDAVYLPTLQERFPGLDDLKQDAIAPLTSVQPDEENRDGSQARSKLEDHAWLRSYYERPCKKYPAGRVVHLVGERMRPVQVEKELPYESPDGTRRSGIHYFHYIRLSDRFWSRSMMELGLQPARTYSKRRTQLGAIYDRGQPKVIVEEGALKKMPSGYPAEVMWLKPGKPQPQVWAGIPPSQAMYQELETLKQDLEHAIGLRVALGENPANVNTYSQLALLRETETRKLDTTIRESRGVIGHLIEDSVYDIGRFWGKEKQVALAGTDGQLKAFEFDASKLQEVFYRVEVAKGSVKPRTQAARLQLVADIFTAALNTGIAKVDPQRWTAWLKESNEQGQPIELPSTPPDYQQTFAEYAKQILATGNLPPLMDFIDANILVPYVRELETEATLAGNAPVIAACRTYLQILVLQEQAKAAKVAMDQAQQQAAPINGQPPQANQLAAALGPGGPGGPPQAAPANGAQPSTQPGPAGP